MCYATLYRPLLFTVDTVMSGSGSTIVASYKYYDFYEFY